MLLESIFQALQFFIKIVVSADQMLISVDLCVTFPTPKHNSNHYYLPVIFTSLHKPFHITTSV